MRKTQTSALLLALTVLAFLSVPAFPSGAGTSAGLALLEAPSARAAALGEAFSATPNDISALSYNPASLGTLQQSNASFLYQKGSVDDAYAHVMIGKPVQKSGMGLSFGYYNSGAVTFFDGTQQRSLIGEKDFTLAAGYAHGLGPISVGVSGKYLSTELLETDKATAWAADLGMQMPINSKVRAGIAIQNVGSQVSFPDVSVPLPRIARAGLNIALFQNKLPTLLLLDAPYFIQDKQLRPAAGVEVRTGPLALRAGYRTQSGLDEGLSLGMGLGVNSFSLDYAFGLVQNANGRQRVSVSMRFGGEQNQNSSVRSIEARKSGETKTTDTNLALAIDETSMASPIKPNQPGSYVIEHGDTLSKIAQKIYGDATMSKLLYEVNKKTISDPAALTTGQRLVLP